MRKNYTNKGLLLISLSFLLLAIASCKKEKPTTPKVVDATPVKIGLYEESDSIIYKILFIPVTTLGTQTLSSNYNALVFDTGSGGMVIDAEGILPASMITSSGFNFTGDSTVYDGITITNQTNTIEYGDDVSTESIVYGNLAYADVTVGDETGNVVIKRVPFFLYYKATDSKGNKYPSHEFDVFGVNPQFDIQIDRSNAVAIESPFTYYTPGTGLTKGFKMGALGTGNFSSASEVPITAGVITLGLTAADLASSSGFTTSTLQYNANDGADPYLPATITYNSKSISANVLFDTGTDPYNYIEDNSAANTITMLPASTPVKVLLTTGFDYSFTTTPTDYLTQVENPGTSQNPITILSLEFFLNNEYMLDYTDHTLGLKNN